jgi:hypothetical protein
MATTSGLTPASPVRYLVAKYIADTWRMEPRNIGVIAVGPTGWAARFVGESPAKPGQIDGRALRGRMGSLPAYRQWIKYWRGLLAQSEQPSSQVVIDRLLESSKGNFELAEGGALLDQVAAGQIEDVAGFLFDQLVAPREKAKDDLELEPESIAVVEQLGLDIICDNLINKTSLPSSPHFFNDFRVKCRVRQDAPEEEELAFSHAYQNGTLHIFQRVPFGRGPSMRRSVHDSAWMFEKVVENGHTDRGSCVSLVYSPPQQRTDEADQLLRVLGVVSKVVDVSDETRALAEFEAVAALDT